MRCPAGCGSAPALTPPPRLWCWTPVSPLTYLTASTPATLTWCALLACQVGRMLTACGCADWVSLFAPAWLHHLFSVQFWQFVIFFFKVCWRLITHQVRRYLKTRRPAKVTWCHWRVVWPVWAPQAAMVPWQQRGPLPSPKQPAQVPLTRQPSKAASVAQVAVCWENATLLPLAGHQSDH